MNKLQMPKTVLTEQGYRAKPHDDYVAFQYEGGNYILPIDDADPTFFQIVFPNFRRISSAAELARAHEAAATVNSTVKTVKIFPVGGADGGQTMAVVDLRLTDPQAFGQLLGPALLSLRIACQQFRMEMGSSEPDGFLAMLREMLERLRGREVGGDHPA